MDLKRLRELQENFDSYLDYCSEQEDYIDEGIGSTIRGLFNRNKKNKQESPKPQGRTAELRAKYGITGRTGENSPAGRILQRSAMGVAATKRKFGSSSQPSTESQQQHQRRLRSQANYFNMDDRRGRGNAAQRRANSLGEDFNIYDILISHLLDEGYAEDVKNAYCILENMSEDWVLEILDEKL